MKAVFGRPVKFSRTGAAILAALTTFAASQAEAGSLRSYSCDAAAYDAAIVPTGGNVEPVITGNAPKMVATFTSSDGKHLIGADEIAKAAVNEVVIDAGAGTKGIFVHALVNRRTVRGQTLTLKTAGEVVLAGAIVLDDDQTVSIDASGLDALGCVGNDPDKSNGSQIEGGQIHLAVGADGVGMSSRPKGQVVTNHVRYLELISVATAKVCLNMMSTGNDTMTMLLGTMNLGGQTLIRLDVQPVITTSGISMNGSGASLLIGPNASLCY